MTEIAQKLNSKPGFDGKEVVDSLGRKIVLRKPDIMDRFYLMRAMGKDASNQMLVIMMYPTIYVAAIDGAPFPTPRTSVECEAALKRLGDEGSDAVNKEINKDFDDHEEEAKETIKK